MAERELTAAPGMLGLFARAGVGMVPGISSLPIIGGLRATDVPDAVLVLPGARADRDRLAAYDRVCGFDLQDELPPTYPHMLAFPLHLALMTDPHFPFPAIGLVHIYNRIVQHRPIDAAEELSLRVWAKSVTPHPRGRQFDVLTEARVGDELVWEEVSTNLRIGGRNDDAAAPTVRSAEALAPSATWTLPGDLGRRYAGVSGDYNPIHIHLLTARLFGFPSAIAHGMWTKARCLAALHSELPAAYTVEVAFKRPVVLPTKVQFAEARDPNPPAAPAAIRFGVRDARKATPHLDGAVTFG